MSKEGTIWIVIGVYALFMLGIGVWYSRKGTDMEGFTVGGRNAGAWISALSYGTAYFSAVMFIGYSGGSGWSYGLWSVLVGVGNAVFGTLLAWLVLANRTRDLTRRHHIQSMPQLFEKRFQSKGMRLFACVVIFVFLIPYSASVYKGLTSVCSVILGIDETVCMLIIAIASAVVLVLGGYMATLKADFVQGIIMMVGVAALIVLVVQSPQVGGLSQGFSRMLDYMESHQMAPLSGSSTLALVSTVLMTSFGTWGLPQMVHKYYGIRDRREVRRGVIISTFFSLLVAGGGYFIGSFSHLFFGEELPAGGTDYIVPLMLNSAGLPNLLTGVILVLLISASVSVQHRPVGLLHRLYGLDQGQLAQGPGRADPGHHHPTAVPGLCGAELPHCQLSHPHIGNDVLLLGDPVRVLPGALPADPLLERHQPGRSLGGHAGRLPHRLCTGCGLGLHHPQRPVVCLPGHGGLFWPVLCGQLAGQGPGLEGRRGKPGVL